MVFGTKQYKNNKESGYLVFDSGKKVYLNSSEVAEFKTKLRLFIQEELQEFLTEDSCLHNYNDGICKTCGAVA